MRRSPPMLPVDGRGRIAGGRRGGTPTGPARWLVALPAWGERCVHLLVNYVVPAATRALLDVDRPATLVVWTDADGRDRLGHAGTDRIQLDVRDPPAPEYQLHEGFGILSTCHRHVLREAGPADRVLLLTADMVVSREVVATCERVLSEGRRLVACVAPRALEDRDPPVGATGRELLWWAWDNRHPMTRECTWPEGRSYDVWRMYFEKDGEIAARVFLPHPLAVVPARQDLRFAPTIDVNLAHNFSQHETYLITDPAEGAVVEVSPADKEFLPTTTMRERMDHGGPSIPPFIRCTNRRHRMFFERRVIIRGAGGDCGDGEVVRRILG